VYSFHISVPFAKNRSMAQKLLRLYERPIVNGEKKKMKGGGSGGVNNKANDIPFFVDTELSNSEMTSDDSDDNPQNPEFISDLYDAAAATDLQRFVSELYDAAATADVQRNSTNPANVEGSLDSSMIESLMKKKRDAAESSPPRSSSSPSSENKEKSTTDPPKNDKTTEFISSFNGNFLNVDEEVRDEPNIENNVEPDTTVEDFASSAKFDEAKVEEEKKDAFVNPFNSMFNAPDVMESEKDVIKEKDLPEENVNSDITKTTESLSEVEAESAEEEVEGKLFSNPLAGLFSSSPRQALSEIEIQTANSANIPFEIETEDAEDEAEKNLFSNPFSALISSTRRPELSEGEIRTANATIALMEDLSLGKIDNREFKRKLQELEIAQIKEIERDINRQQEELERKRKLARGIVKNNIRKEAALAAVEGATVGFVPGVFYGLWAVLEENTYLELGQALMTYPAVFAALSGFLVYRLSMPMISDKSDKFDTFVAKKIRQTFAAGPKKIIPGLNFTSTEDY